jgi:hypothetical protein
MAGLVAAVRGFASDPASDTTWMSGNWVSGKNPAQAAR